MDENPQKPLTAGIRRREFLEGLAAAGALIALIPASIRLAGASSVTTAPVEGSVSFIVLGDFGAGNNTSFGTDTDQPNPNELAVARGIWKLLPPASGGYILSVGDQIYIPTASCDPDDTGETIQAVDVESSYDLAVGYFYHEYILFPEGSSSRYAGQGASQMNFHAMLGDHDWWHQPRITVPGETPDYPMNDATYQPGQPNPTAPGQTLYVMGTIQGRYESCDNNNFSGYLQYFGNQGAGSSSNSIRYYDFVRGNVHWIVLSSDANETILGADGQSAGPPYTLSNGFYLPENALLPNGLTFGQDNLHNSPQGQWFQQAALASTSRWKFVGTHYPPFSSSASNLDGHPSATYMQWGYEHFGVDAVFSGHVHGYERLYSNGVAYVVCGSGGTFESLSGYVDPPIPQSIIIVQGQYGFLSAQERPGLMFFTYHTVEVPDQQDTGGISDRFVFVKGGTLSDLDEIQAQDTIHITSAGGTIDIGNRDLTLGDVLAGTGPLTIKGSGTFRLGVPNPNYTGKITILKPQPKPTPTPTPEPDTFVLKGSFNARQTRERIAAPLEVTGRAAIAVTSRTRLLFPPSRQTPWSKTAILVIRGPLGRRSIRFGTNRNGLGQRQLRQIRFSGHPGATARLDAAGYLMMIPAS